MGRLELTPEQRQGLQQQLIEAQGVRLYRRTLAILECDRGRTATDIAQMLGVARQSVSNWVASYTHAHDPAALADTDRAGRPRLLDEEATGVLQTLLAASPQDCGLPNTSWTVPLLRETLERGTGCGASCRTLRRELGRLGYVWKRPRYVLAPDAEREKKTAHPAAAPGPAAAECRAGAGRDRPAALPAAAGRLVAARRGGGSPAEWPERPAGHLRGPQPAHGDAAVRAAAEGPQR